MELTGEQLYRLHSSGGGNMTWREVGVYARISWQSARGKVRRWLKKQEREIDEAIIASYPVNWPYQPTTGDDKANPYITPPGLPETARELETRVKHIEDMLEKLVGKQTEEDAEGEDNPF